MTPNTKLGFSINNRIARMANKTEDIFEDMEDSEDMEDMEDMEDSEDSEDSEESCDAEEDCAKCGLPWPTEEMSTLEDGDNICPKCSDDPDYVNNA
jgi:hypothetical protein